MILNILHITDLHIKKFDEPLSEDKQKTVDFQNNLFAYLTNDYNDQIDYLIVSGDLGDQGPGANLTEAKRLIQEFKKTKNIATDKIIMCPGNHDMDTEYLANDHTQKRLIFCEANKYIREGYSAKVFQEFNNAVSELSNPLNIIEGPDYRFIVINSSWLSQFSLAERIALKAKMASPYTPSEVDDYHREHAGIFYKGSMDSFRGWTYNYSENKHQQLGAGLGDQLESPIAKVLDDGKFNILVFHHPEWCLHSFEKFSINGIEATGIYESIANAADLLICGHIHPITNQDLSPGGTHLPMLIGAAAHYIPRPEGNALIRPVFYHYKIETQEKNEGFGCLRKMYYVNEHGRIEHLPDEIIPYNPLKEPQNTSTSLSSANAYPTELRVNELKYRINRCLQDMLTNDFKRLSLDVAINHEFPLVEFESGYYFLTGRTNRFSICCEKFEITIEIIYADELTEHEFVVTKIEKGYDDVKRKFSEEHGSNKKYIYFPLVVDFLGMFIEKKSLDNYISKVNKLVELLFDRVASFKKSRATLINLMQDEGLVKQIPESLKKAGILFNRDILFMNYSDIQSILKK